MKKEFSKEIFFAVGEFDRNAKGLVYRCDFAFELDPNLSNPESRNSEGKKQPVIIGEIALSEPTSHMTAKCLSYIKDFGANVVLGIDIPSSANFFDPSDIKHVDLFIFYDDMNEVPSPIPIPLDEEFSFYLESKYLVKKMKKESLLDIKYPRKIKVEIILRRRILFEEV